jgi:hypothetical protein
MAGLWYSTCQCSSSTLVVGHALINGLHIYLGLSNFNVISKLHLMDRNMWSSSTKWYKILI